MHNMSIVNSNIINNSYLKYHNIINKLPLEKYFNKLNNIDKKISNIYITKHFDKLNNLNLLKYYNTIIGNYISEEFNNTIIENSTSKEYNDVIKDTDTENYNIIISKNNLNSNDIQKKLNKYNLLPAYADIFYNLSKFDIIEDGFYSDSEKFILEIMKYDINFALRILSYSCTIYCEKETVLISILHIIQGFESD